MKRIFGAAYYDEYMPEDRLLKDIDMMKKANINTVRIAESTWSTLEPKPGHFDFSSVDRVIRTMHENGIDCIVGTPTYAIPAWLAKMDPSIMVVTGQGQARYGRRQMMDISNSTYRERCEIVIRALIEHVVAMPGVIGFQVDNETKHYGTAGPSVQAKFVQYLKDKFVTTENLNRTFGLAYWSNSIADWEDFPDILGTINGGLACEFEKFQRSLVTDFLSWQASIINEYRLPHQFITHNLDYEWKKFGPAHTQEGYSYGIAPHVDHADVSKALTLVGTDIYHMTQDELTGAEIAFGGDMSRSLKNQSYLVLETEAQAFKHWVPYPGQLRLQYYSHLASGAMGVMYWNWHSIHNSYESYWKGLLSHDLQENPTYLEACQIGAEMKMLGIKLNQLSKRNRVAVLVSNESLSLLHWFPTDAELSYNDVFRWMYDSLYEMNIECDIVFPQTIDMERYDCIITPILYSAEESLLERLRDFVQRGGVLVSCFRTAVANQYGTIYHDTQPHMLNECFGIRYNQFTAPKGVTLNGLGAGEPVTYWMDLVQPEGAEVLATYEHQYWKKYAAITRNQYGRGKAYYVGCYTTKDALKAVYRDVFGIGAFTDQWPVIRRTCRNGEGMRLEFVLNYSQETRRVISNVSGCSRELLSGQQYQAGEQLYVEPYGVLILCSDLGE